MDSNIGYSYGFPNEGWSTKLRYTMTQFSDLFSEFNKYISPAYHHDRCERSVQMRMYSMHKGELAMVLIAFFAFLGLGVFVGLAGPSPTKMTTISGSEILLNQSNICQGTFHLHSPALGTRAQQLWLYAQILTQNDDEEIFDKSFQISISIEGVLDDHSTVTLVPENYATNSSRHLRCYRQDCDDVMILHLGALDYTHYVLNVNFYGLHEFHKRYTIREVNFHFKTYNPQFTQMETWFRFIFLLTTFLVACIFAHSLRKFPTQDWAIEQKWLSILLPLLLLFNDPLYPLRLVSGGCFAPLVDAIFQTTFLTCIMLSWLALYHGLRQNERSFLSFYLFKVIIVASIWIPAIILAYWQNVSAFYDPTFNYLLSADYQVVKFIFFSAVVFYFLYLVILIVKAYSDLRNMPFFDLRLRCLSTVVGTTSTLTLLLTLKSWGPAALQSHWASQPDIHYDTSASFMATYCLFNIQLYILAYLFAPGVGSIHDSSITKDNPTFSMINDSDEDVIYGSDEDSRRPLNASHRHNDQLELGDRTMSKII